MSEKINTQTVEKIAHLARLEFENETKEQMLKDMNNMLAFVDKLGELDTADVLPLVYMTDETNNLREDEVKEDISHQDALRNAPKHDSDYFKIPKVVEKK